LSDPRTRRGPIPNRWKQPSTTVAIGTAGPDRPGQGLVAWQRGFSPALPDDGVAHEAPLSPVWRVYKFAEPKGQPHASTRARFQMGAPVARQPTPSSAK